MCMCPRPICRHSQVRQPGSKRRGRREAGLQGISGVSHQHDPHVFLITMPPIPRARLEDTHTTHCILTLELYILLFSFHTLFRNKYWCPHYILLLNSIPKRRHAPCSQSHTRQGLGHLHKRQKLDPGKADRCRACGDLPLFLAQPPHTWGQKGSLLTCSKLRLAFLKNTLSQTTFYS